MTPVRAKRCPAADLDAAERLVVETARAWLVHKGPSYLYERRLITALGHELAEPVQRPFHAVMTNLFLRARRPMGLNRPGCAGVSTDERAIVNLFAAAANGQGDMVKARLDWLLPPTVHGLVAVSVERAGRGIVAAGYTFASSPVRRGTPRANANARHADGDPTPLRLLG